MPKMKTHRGAAKRFHVTSTGKIRRRRAFVSHMLEKKSANRKRRLRAPGAEVSRADKKRVRRMLGE
jgi:large subunit ribosomal protein L35